MSKLCKIDKNERNRQADDIDQYEEPQISADPRVFGFHVEAQGDQTGQRSDGSPQPADVRADQQGAPVLREAGQQHRRWDIADELARQHGCEERVNIQQILQKNPHGVDCADVAGKYEEAHEGEQQAVVDLPKEGAVCEKQRRTDHRQQNQIVQHMKYGQQAEQKEDAVQKNMFLAHGFPGLRQRYGQFALRAQKHAERQERQRQQCVDQNGVEKVGCREVKGRIYVQVLGIADRRGHTAQVGGYRLHDDDEDHVALLAGQLQNQDCKGHKGDQSHVVGHQHGGEEGQQDQFREQGAALHFAGQYLTGEPVEQTVVLQAGDYRHQAEQKRQDTKINIVEISRGRRHEEHGDHHAERGCDQHGFFF